MAYSIRNLVARLKSKEAATRRKAAQTLLAAAEEGQYFADAPLNALCKAVSDPDEETRQTAAFAVLEVTFQLGSVFSLVRRMLASEDAATRKTATVALFKAVERFPPKPAKLLPIAVAALFDPDPATREEAIWAFRICRRYGGVRRKSRLFSVAIERLASLLETPNALLAAEELRELARLAPIPEARRHLAPSLATGGRVRLFAAGALTLDALREGDAVGLATLLAHESVDVREVVVREICEVAERRDIAVAMPALGAALGDSGGGVVYHAVRALLSALERKADLSPVAEQIDALRRSGMSYSYSRWSSGAQIWEIDEELRGESLAWDTTWLLVRHLANREDVRGLAAALDTPSESSRELVRRALRCVARDRKLPKRLAEGIAELLGGEPE